MSEAYISQQCAKRHRSSNMNETPLYLKQFWLAISMPHCHHSSPFYPTSPLYRYFFVFFRSAAPEGAPLQWRQKESRLFFFGGVGGVILVVAYHRRSPPNVQHCPVRQQPRRAGERHSWVVILCPCLWADRVILLVESAKIEYPAVAVGMQRE